MTAPTPFPDPADREAVRRWVRSHRLNRGDRAPATPEEFAALQRHRLLRGRGVPEHLDEGRGRLEVALTGPATALHLVRVSILGQFLANLQESVSAVAQALTGRPTSQSSIPRSIRDATELNAAAVFPSSFGVVIFGPPEPNAEDALFPNYGGDVRTVLDDALDTVMDVVDLSEGLGQSDEPLAERLVPLGQRAMKHLGALTAGLADSSLGLRVDWYSRAGTSRRSEWTPGGAQRVRFVCEHSEFSATETVTMVGWLGGASAIRGTVEIRTDSNHIVHASTDADLTPRLPEFFGNRVEAVVEVTTVQGAGGRERKVYVVAELINADGPSGRT